MAGLKANRALVEQLEHIKQEREITTPLASVHKAYGLLLLLVGVFLFVRPPAVLAAYGFGQVATNHPTGVLAQTTGLIVSVLGLYSLAAGLQEWSLTFFRVLALPKLGTAIVLAYFLKAGVLPDAFWTWVWVEAGIGILTWHLAARGPPAYRVQFCWDRVFFAQALHGVLSGANP